MKIWLQISVFLLGIGMVRAQGFDQLDAYLEASGTFYQAGAKEQISNFVNKLNSKRRKTDRQYLAGVFGLTHRHFLKEYHQYSNFSNIFDRGRYDCVTATALYSLILKELGFEHRIVETKYHIFILVESPEGQMLMESTDPIGGFEYRQDRIEQRIAQYLIDDELPVEQLNSSEGIAPMNTVTPVQLTGLLYYNQCVKQFNENQLKMANRLLSKAKLFYDSPRMMEMERILQDHLDISEVEIVSSNVVGHQISQRQEP